MMKTPGLDDLRWGKDIIRRDGWLHWCEWYCCDEETIVNDAMLDYMVSCVVWLEWHTPMTHLEHQMIIAWEEKIFGGIRRVPHPDEYRPDLDNQPYL